jgi:hypothetical protein
VGRQQRQANPDRSGPRHLATVGDKWQRLPADRRLRFTAYFATFELESGERLEFVLSGRAYGLLAEGDSGTLTYQGTRYHGFERGPRPS